LHTTYNTHLIAGTSSSEMMADTITIPLKEFAKQAGGGWPSWAFSNHDVVRSATRWGKGIKDKESFAVMLNKLLLSLRGTPFLYQGEELGLPEASIPYEKLQDPWGIFMWPEWQGRDGCRTPMPWNSDKAHAGFSTRNVNETWLPIPHEHVVRAVDTQTADNQSVLSQTREFIQWRKTQPILQIGDIEFEETNNQKLIAFNRSLDDKNMRCIFNLSEDVQSYDGRDIEPLATIFE